MDDCTQTIQNNVATIEKESQADPLHSLTLDIIETDVTIGFYEWCSVVDCAHESLRRVV